MCAIVGAVAHEGVSLIVINRLTSVWVDDYWSINESTQWLAFH